jgi:predicted nucleic acid-binding protein
VFKIVEPKDKVFLESLLQTKGLHMADAEVLTIAKEHDGTAIIDDDVARKTAKIYGISYAGTPYILAKAVSEEIVTKEKAKQAIILHLDAPSEAAAPKSSQKQMPSRMRTQTNMQATIGTICNIIKFIL